MRIQISIPVKPYLNPHHVLHSITHSLEQVQKQRTMMTIGLKVKVVWMKRPTALRKMGITRETTIMISSKSVFLLA